MAMTRIWNRSRVWLSRAIGVAMIVLAALAFHRSGLSWIMIALVAIAVGCVAAMVCLWWVSAQTTRAPGGTLQQAASPSEGSDAACIGVVLSSGGSRGVHVHTGLLPALERMGIHIHASAACSAGMVVGGVAAGDTGLGYRAHRMRRTWQEKLRAL